jgi:Doubled CXXCH motif (Paired_CXXCH_1)
MKRPGLLAGIATALCILLVLLFIYPHQMIAPGALREGHAQLETNCFACHAPLRGVSSARCAACHLPSEIGLKTTRGRLVSKPTKRAAFHGQLKEADCTACHSDHAANLLTARHPKTFDHSLLKPAIASLCATCHAKPAGALHAAIVDGCAQCHQTSSWTPATFAHERYFQLDRAHNVACTTCHTGNIYTRYTCYGCHAHQPAQIAAIHAEEGIGNIENCARCHRSAQGEGENGDEEEE